MAIAYYIIDTETTGLRHNFHDLTEISVIRYSDRLQITRQVKAINPNNASYDALKITGKTMADLSKGMNQEDMIADVEEYFTGDNLTPAHRCIVAHNAPFDMKFLHSTWSRNNKKFPAHLWLDTLTLSKKIAKASGKVGSDQRYNLQAVCDLFGVKKIAGAHNAQDDARNTYLLLKRFIDSGQDFLENIKNIPHTDDDE